MITEEMMHANLMTNGNDYSMANIMNLSDNNF